MIDLPDVNVWVALVYSKHVNHNVALRYISTVEADSAAICRVSQFALLRLLTNPAVMRDEVCTQAQAWETFDQLMSDSRVVFLDEPAELQDRWRKFSSLAKPATNQWADGYLAAFATGHGLRLVTFDRGFKAFSGLNTSILA